MSERSGNKAGKAKPGDPRQLTWVVLAAGGVIVAVTIYLWLRPEEPPPAAPNPARPTTADEVIAAAQAGLKSRQFGPAISLMQSYVRAYPTDIEVRPLLAEGLYQQAATEEEPKKTALCDEAEHTIDDVLRLSPRMPRALWLKGQLMRRRGKSPELMFREAALSPEADGEIWARYGRFLLEQGKAQEAREYLQKAMDAGATDASVLSGLGQLAMQDGDFAKAQELLSQALAKEPADADVAVSLAGAQEAAGNRAAAEKTLRQSLSSRHSPAALMALGQLMFDENRPKEAAEAFASAADYPATRVEAAFLAAKCYCLADRYALALGFIDIAAAERPDDQDVAAWKKKIEDAHFVRPGAVTAPARQG